MLIPIASVLLAIFILVIPFMAMIIIIRRMSKKELENDRNSLELRVEILEEEIKELKKHIEFLDEL